VSHVTTEQIPDLLGRIVEVGRNDGKNEVIVDLGRGQQVTVSGFSDDMARTFGRSLYKPMRIEFGVIDE